MGKAREGEVFRRVCADLPEPVRVLFANAIELARLSGARSTVEAYEFLSVTFIHAAYEPQSEWEARCTSPEAKSRLVALKRAGWRCEAGRAGLWECHSSLNLECHHVITRELCRDTGRLDLLVDPRNLMVACAPCHRRIQPNHQEHAPALLAYIAKATEENP